MAAPLAPFGLLSRPRHNRNFALMQKYRSELISFTGACLPLGCSFECRASSAQQRFRGYSDALAALRQAEQTDARSGDSTCLQLHIRWSPKVSRAGQRRFSSRTLQAAAFSAPIDVIPSLNSRHPQPCRIRLTSGAISQIAHTDCSQRSCTHFTAMSTVTQSSDATRCRLNDI